MAYNKEDYIKRWEKIQEKGLLNFALKRGVLFGVFLFLFTGLLDLSSRGFADVFMSPRSFQELIIWLVGGIVIYSPVIWFLNNRRYRKFKEEADQ